MLGNLSNILLYLNDFQREIYLEFKSKCYAHNRDKKIRRKHAGEQYDGSFFRIRTSPWIATSQSQSIFISFSV